MLEYVFPGDVLIFTIELQDPNFEFITLLAVTFNDKVIRANVSDTIFTTRDCGTNICIDFPFEIDIEVKTYTVQEVKFAKLNDNKGVNAIIDLNSKHTLTLDIYDQDIFPYVLEAVELLNNMIDSRTFYNQSIFPEEYHDYFYNLDFESAFVVINWQNFIDDSIVKTIIGSKKYYMENGITYENFDFVYAGNNGHGQHMRLEFKESEQIYPNPVLLDRSPVIWFSYYTEKYKDIYFFNNGNKIFVNILNENYFLIEFYNHMRLKPLSEFVA